MGAAARTLVVMRHAKAESEGPTDADRALAERGHLDARAAGSWLAESGVTPDHALVSAARRTRETWESLAAGGGWNLDPALDPGLYTAGVDTALDVVRLLDDTVRSTVLIGHNPTMGTLAQLLDDGSGAASAVEEMMRGFPTAALAVFDVDGSWADLAFGSARLRAFHVARD